MKLTYTIPNLSVQNAADLEKALADLDLHFDVRPSETDRPPQEPAPAKPTLRKLSQAEVVEIYRVLKDDEQDGRRQKTEEYAHRFGICTSTVNRIDRGDHPAVPEKVKAEYRKERPTEGTETTEGGKESGPLELAAPGEVVMSDDPRYPHLGGVTR